MKNKLKKKKLLFEYIFYQLNLRKDIDKKVTFTRMGKILFLLSSINATKEDNNLLIYFDKFYPEEFMGICEADILKLWKNNQFKHLRKCGDGNNFCELVNIEDNTFNGITDEEKEMVNNSIDSLSAKLNEYFTMELFDLIGIIKQWMAVSVGIEVIKLVSSFGQFNPYKYLLSTEDIINSTIKAY